METESFLLSKYYLMLSEDYRYRHDFVSFRILRDKNDKLFTFNVPLIKQ
jgi:hypothetical protein